MNRKQASHDRKRSAKSKSIGWFQAMACRRQGRADGRCAIQLSLDNDCISPYVQEMVTLCHKRTLEEIQRLRRYRDEQFIEEANLYASLQRNDEQQGDCWDHLQLIGSGFDLERVEAGEDHLKSQIRRKRRQRELEDLESKDREKLHQLVLEGAALRQRLDELKAANREAELKTRLEVERIRTHAEAAITIYYRALLRSHPESDQMPPTISIPRMKGDALFDELIPDPSARRGVPSDDSAPIDHGVIPLRPEDPA